MELNEFLINRKRQELNDEPTGTAFDLKRGANIEQLP